MLEDKTRCSRCNSNGHNITNWQVLGSCFVVSGQVKSNILNATPLFLITSKPSPSSIIQSVAIIQEVFSKRYFSTPRHGVKVTHVKMFIAISFQEINSVWFTWFGFAATYYFMCVKCWRCVHVPIKNLCKNLIF